MSVVIGIKSTLHAAIVPRWRARHAFLVCFVGVYFALKVIPFKKNVTLFPTPFSVHALKSCILVSFYVLTDNRAEE